MTTGLDTLVAAAMEGCSGDSALFADRPYAGIQPQSSVPVSPLALAVVVWPVNVNLLAALRDQWADRVVLLGPDSVDAQQLVALGFTPTDCGNGCTQFEFDIAHYKNTPDWLNPKGWANPENWDKYRW